MFLANPQDVLQRMSLGSTAQGNITSAQSVLGAATPVVQNIIGTELSEATVYDRYDYRIKRSRSKFEPYVLYLTRGFVNSEQSVVVYSSNDGKAVDLTGSNHDVIDPEHYDIDYDLGLITMHKDLAQYPGRSLVTYAAGFGVDGDQVAQDIPEWLKQAAITACVNLLHQHVTAYNKSDIFNMQRGLHVALERLITTHIRPALNVKYPSSSVVRD